MASAKLHQAGVTKLYKRHFERYQAEDSKTPALDAQKAEPKIEVTVRTYKPTPAKPIKVTVTK